ncbi:MAG: MaoC family dehydratase [Alphaproteobacteria bacterium]|nr:MaoC family dehydratase [Alphaproteobacteria bacterium]
MSTASELHGLYFEDLKIGMTAVYGATITDALILMFASASGDTNPVHLNEEFAAPSRFKGRIAHGMLTGSFISTVIGTKLPGPGAIYVSQSLKFKAPVRAGETVTARATVTALNPEKKLATLSTVCTVAGKPVLEGEAVVLVPSRG